MGTMVNGVTYCDECGNVTVGHCKSGNKTLCIACSIKKESGLNNEEWKFNKLYY